MKITLEQIQFQLLEKGFDVDLVFDPIVESHIKSIIEMNGKAGWEATKQLGKKLLGRGTEEVISKIPKKPLVRSKPEEYFLHPMMKKPGLKAKPAEDLWAGNKAVIGESIKKVVSKLKNK